MYVYGLVSFFNGISNFMDAKAILVGKTSMILFNPYLRGYMGVHAFCKGMSLNGNITMKLEFSNSYFEAAV